MNGALRRPMRSRSLRSVKDDATQRRRLRCEVAQSRLLPQSAREIRWRRLSPNRDGTSATSPLAWPGSRGLTKQHFAGLRGHFRRRVESGAARVGPDRRRAVAYRFKPALQIRKIREILPLRLVGHDPWVGGHVGDRIIAGEEIAFLEPPIEHAVKAIRLVDVAVDRVRNLFGCIACKVMILPGHGS